MRMSPFSAKNGSLAQGLERVHDRTARAEGVRLGDPHDARVAVASLDERVEHLLEVGGGEHDLVHPVASHVIEHVIEERRSIKGSKVSARSR